MIFYPLNETDYSAKDVAIYNATRTTGIYSDDDFRCTCTGFDSRVTIGIGIGWMRLSRLFGGAFALETEATLDLGLADEYLPRYDMVGVRFSSEKNGIEPFIKKGTPSENPVYPAIVQNAGTYELYFTAVYREATVTEITSDALTDLRLDSRYCGLMADSITKVDTEQINSQFAEFLAKIRRELQNIKDNQAYVFKTGDTMQGDLNMAGYTIKNLPFPTDDGDAIPKGYFSNWIVDHNTTKQSEIEKGFTTDTFWHYLKFSSGLCVAFGHTPIYKKGLIGGLVGAELPCNKVWRSNDEDRTQLYSTDVLDGVQMPMVDGQPLFKSIYGQQMEVQQKNGTEGAKNDVILLKGMGEPATVNYTASFGLARPIRLNNILGFGLSFIVFGVWK